MPAKTADELKTFCTAIKLRLTQGNVVTIKCSWKLKTAPATDALQVDLLGLVQFRKGEEGPDASLTIRWISDGPQRRSLKSTTSRSITSITTL